MTAALRLSETTHQHDAGDRVSLGGVSLEIAPGETVALLGPSGAGKTTLLALIDGRLRGWHGAANVLGRPLSPSRTQPGSERAEVGFIFQEFALVDRATVRQNVLNGRLGRTNALRAFFGQFSAADMVAADRAMADTGIADLASRRADSLSGGQRQRVAIARCLAQEPRLILADEPVSNLDPTRASDILGLITGAAQARGATVVFSSHQPDLARRFARRVVGMRNGCIKFDCPADRLDANMIEDLYREDQADPKTALRLVV